MIYGATALRHQNLVYRSGVDQTRSTPVIYNPCATPTDGKYVTLVGKRQIATFHLFAPQKETCPIDSYIIVWGASQQKGRPPSRSGRRSAADPPIVHHPSFGAWSIEHTKTRRRSIDRRSLAVDTPIVWPLSRVRYLAWHLPSFRARCKWSI